jgi:hypothetical protein
MKRLIELALKVGGLERIANAYTGRQGVQYGERERPEH